MNRIAYNYKGMVSDVPNAYTVRCLIDLGLRVYVDRRLKLAGYMPSDEQSILAYQTLRLALTRPDGKWRTVVASPLKPDEHGRAPALVYLPARKLNPEYPDLTIDNLFGYTLLRLVPYLKQCAEWAYDPARSTKLLASFEVYDFDK